MLQEDRSYERRLPATPRSLAEFRSTLRDWLEGAVAEPERRADIVLAASELAAAAMRAVTEPGTAVGITAWIDDGAVIVESCAEVDHRGSRGGRAQAFEGSDGERGFSIVAALSDVFAVKDMPNAVVVRARLRRGRFGALTTG
jgi:anti-sigma regulatory factor (Ser/Thr protein kinase)